jgi:glycogen debranching enzyme
MATPWTYAGSPPALSHADSTVTLVDGQTFCLSAHGGDFVADLPHGLFVLDTRVLSRWELRVNGHFLEPLAVAPHAPFEASFIGRGHPGRGEADAGIVVLRHRSIGNGLHERIVVRNYGLDPANLVVELGCDSDFAGLFEVKEDRVRPRPQPPRHETGPGMLAIVDAGGTQTTVSVTDDAAVVAAGLVTWRFELAPREERELCVEVGVRLREVALPTRFGCGDESEASVPTQRYAAWLGTVPTVDTDAPVLAGAVARAVRDLGALRIFDPEHPELPVVAAGAPWFMTVFGRDSLLTGWMSLIAEPDLARGVLETLARFQGREVNPATEEEPGRILHEMRFGAATRLALGGGDVYYGSVDATPLFVMLLGELRRWGLADEVVTQLLPHADAALGWIEHFGDRDGDGYVEYQRATPAGLTNQGWKDSWDAIRFADGRLAEAPIALCEVQGYTYAAYVARAHFADEAGDRQTQARYLERARQLKEAFNRDFWLEDRGWYALGLDADKHPIDALASNMGHCLWTGIVDDAKAPEVAERLLSPDLFNDWGIRTLAKSMRAYNPVSYHNGSVWPHDSALCAAGLMRYGFVDEALRVINGLLGASAASGGSLPELFAGLARSDMPTPVAYPTSCAPQAWASASALQILRLILRLEPAAPHGRIWVAPVLPPGVGRLRVAGIDIAGQELTIDVDADADRCEISGAGPLTITTAPRPR